LRLLRIVSALAVTGAALLAYSLPRLEAQSASTNSTENTVTQPAANVPIVIANGVSARALALSAATAAENPARPELYLTAPERPNRVLELASAARSNAVSSAAGSASNFATIAGNGEAGSLGDGGAASAGQFNLKFDSLYLRSGVAVAADGTMFVADTHNATVRRIAGATSSDAGVIRSVAGKWAPPQNVQLVEPMGIAVDRAGNLYIADHGANAVIELHSATSSTPGRLEILAHVAQPANIAVTADGSRIFVASAESCAVFSFNAQTRAISQLLGASSSAAAAASVDTPTPSHANVFAAAGSVTGGVAATARISANSSANISPSSCPSGLAVDGGANLFIADANGNRILRIDASTGKTSVAATSIVTPGEIAFDANGNLFIAEQGRNRISEIKSLGQPVSSVTLTAPAPIVPPAGVPCPTIAPPPGFASNFNFCSEPLAGATPTAAFILANNSNADITGITIGTIGLSPSDFVSQSTSCTATLAANSTCAINLAFAPMATGTRTATLVVNYTGANVPLASAVAGTGDEYQLALANGQLTQISVDAGNKATFMLQVVPDAIFTGTVTFVCPGNMPRQTTCSFSPTSVTVTTPATPVPFSVSFQTTSRVPMKTVAPDSKPSTGRGPGAGSLYLIRSEFILVVVFAALAMIGLFASAITEPRRRAQLLRVASVIALALTVAAILEGCHSGSGTTGVTGTPAGSNKMIVQGAAQNATRGITVTLDVL
jgi:sugar lactone lactonase YvrE